VKRAVEQLKEFHAKFGVPVLDKPTIPHVKRCDLRTRLITEEAEELLYAIHTGNLPEIADGIADLIYVALGTALEFGLTNVIDEVFDEVHKTNMLKIEGGTDAKGKIQKPQGWVAPDIAGILKRAEQPKPELHIRNRHADCDEADIKAKELYDACLEAREFLRGGFPAPIDQYSHAVRTESLIQELTRVIKKATGE
jgi:predicted HAD superfamily Cof-like phosphohydrolase